MSNSDDQLDALYEQTKSDSASPPEIDARVRAAAQKAIENSQTREPVAHRAWRARYGWASAAMLMLTTALFVSLPDSTPPLESLNRDSQSAAPTEQITAGTTEVTPAAEAAPPPAVPAQTQAAPDLQKQIPQSRVSEIQAPETQPTRTQPTERSAKKTVIGFSEPARHSRAAPPAVANAASDSVDAVVLSDYDQVEEVIVTGSKASRNRNCTSFENLLIDRVCKEPKADKDTEQGYALYATRQSNCAGRKYVLTTTTGEPEPHESSDKSRFVFMPDEAEARNSLTEPQPEEMLICKFGRLKLQAFARGR